MGNVVVDNAYYEWLLDKIEYQDCCFDTVLETLHATPFRWSVANDDNRAEDGITLRSIFMDEENWSTCPRYDEPCSCLEMIIALANRMENDIMWDGEKDRTAEWFWIMIRNLGFSETSTPTEIHRIIEGFLDREIFLFHTHLEPEKVEIWYQAQAFLMENYW